MLSGWQIKGTRNIKYDKRDWRQHNTISGGGRGEEGDKILGAERKRKETKHVFSECNNEEQKYVLESAMRKINDRDYVDILIMPTFKSLI